MSQLFVDNIKNRTGRAVGFPTGVVVTGVATFNNQVSIAGTLTYEDVTNVDSTGIITAKSGVVVSGGDLKVGSAFTVGQAGVATSGIRVGSGITIDSASGIITATAFVGSGASLTDVISGVELKFGGNSVGTAVTSINFVGFSSITAPSSGLSTVTAPSVAKSSAIANFIGG